MCKTCGCDKRSRLKFEVNKSVTEANDAVAHELGHSLKEKGILCINLLGAPGSGKTSVIEGLVKHIGSARIAAIEGDLESDVDKKRLAKSKVVCYQINTHSGCHLNADMISKAVGKMDLSGKQFLIIENVGNLVCPAGVRIGQHMDMVVSSTTEGYDKPEKYPLIFMDASLIVISKYDLAKHVSFDEGEYVRGVRKVNPNAAILKTSTTEPSSFRELAHFIVHEREHLIGARHSH